MVFPVVMCRCESWTVKKTECWRIDAFELWGWRRLLRVPWTARRCNQSILKEISPEYSLERLMLKLKLQYFGHVMRSANSLGNVLMLKWLKIDRIKMHPSTGGLCRAEQSWSTTLMLLFSCLVASDFLQHQASLSTTNSWSLRKLIVCWVTDAIQPSQPLSSPSPPAFNLSQHQGLFQWISSSHQVAKVLKKLQHQFMY